MKNETFILDCIPERQKTFLVGLWLQENGSGILLTSIVDRFHFHRKMYYVGLNPGMSHFVQLIQESFIKSTHQRAKSPKSI